MQFLQFTLGAVFAEGENQNPFGFPGMWILVIGIIFLYYFVVIRGGRRERTSRQEMLNSLKKNDRVVTIGGIIGTVASTSQDGKEVTLKIDDNARLKVLRSAIQGPLREQDQKADGDKNSKDRLTEESAKS